MDKNLIKSIFKIGIIVLFIFDANFSQKKINFSGVSDSNSKEGKKMKKTESEWKRALTPEEYYILREKGTERAFTGKYDKHFEAGVYACAGCGTDLFESGTKYDSGCGWPSFFEQLSPDSIKTEVDNSLGMTRIEIMCAKCDAHLGHVFDDGPQPSGKRYCVNSLSINYEEFE